MLLDEDEDDSLKWRSGKGWTEIKRGCFEPKFGKDGVKMRRKIGDSIIEVGGYRCVCGDNERNVCTYNE